MPNDTFSQLSRITNDTRAAGLRSEDPFFLNEQRGGLASQLAGTTGQTNYNKFAIALMDMMKQYQQIGTGKFLEAELKGREEQSRRALAPLSPELAGAALSPSQILGVKGAQVGAVQPTITGAQELRQTFTEQLQSLGTAMDRSLAVGTWVYNMEQADKQDARDILNSIDLNALIQRDEKAAKALLKRAGISWDLKDYFIQQQLAGAGGEIQEDIVKDIRNAISSYKLNPSGFRERFINSLTSRYGEGARNFIADQVYSYMPDIPETEDRFITSNWFEQTYGGKEGIKNIMMSDETTKKQLIEDMKKARGWKTVWPKDVNEELERYLTENPSIINSYLEGLMDNIERHRQAGKTDREILEEMLAVQQKQAGLIFQEQIKQ